jgi:hypothetical protein
MRNKVRSLQEADVLRHQAFPEIDALQPAMKCHRNQFHADQRSNSNPTVIPFELRPLRHHRTARCRR